MSKNFERPIVKHSIDIYWDNETKQYVGVSKELNYTGMGNTIEEAVKNTNTAVEEALKWCKEHGTIEEVLKEAGYLIIQMENEKVWDHQAPVANFSTKIFL